MSIKQFQQELSKELPSPAYLFYSSEDFLLHETLSAVKEKYQGSDAFNLDVFDINSPDDVKPVEQIADVLNTLPFLSERRVVIIQNIQKIPQKDAKKIEDYISAPSNTSLLVMLFKGTAPKLFDASASKNMKTIGLSVPEKDIPLWVKGRAKGKGVEITDRAIEYLINCAGTDLGMLSAEIEKFSSWNTSQVDIEDIKGMVYAGAEYSPFDLGNALRNKDKREVFRIFENVSKNTEPQTLLGALNWQYASLRSRSQGRDEGSFSRIFRLLHEADAGIKTSKSHVMEELLIRLLKN